MCAAIFAISMAVKAVLAIAGAVHPAAWCNTFGRLEPIALGALLACRKPGTLPASELFSWLRLLLALVMVVIANTFFPWNYVTLGSGIITYPLAALASAVFIDTAMHSCIFRRVLGIRPIVYLGRISYGLYVFHVGSLYLSDAMFRHVVRDWGEATFLRPAIAFTITLLFAVISYELMEKYFLRLKLRFTRIESRPGG
jgi:peptidoglycan/LPS O-acetylase OafA/YrhL